MPGAQKKNPNFFMGFQIHDFIINHILKRGLPMTYYDRKKDSKKPTKETGGPVVKTGPPAGQNRTRNIEGSWRKTVQMHVLLKNNK